MKVALIIKKEKNHSRVLAVKNFIMNYKRREFIRMGGNLAAAFALAPVAGKLFSNENEKDKLDKFGIQLWTVKMALAKDPQGVLKQLSQDGYKQIESFE